MTAEATGGVPNAVIGDISGPVIVSGNEDLGTIAGAPRDWQDDGGLAVSLSGGCRVAASPGAMAISVRSASGDATQLGPFNVQPGDLVATSADGEYFAAILVEEARLLRGKCSGDAVELLQLGESMVIDTWALRGGQLLQNLELPVKVLNPAIALAVSNEGAVAFSDSAMEVHLVASR